MRPREPKIDQSREWWLAVSFVGAIGCIYFSGPGSTVDHWLTAAFAVVLLVGIIGMKRA